MKPNVYGVSAVLEILVTGGAADGLASLEDLAVDVGEDLAIDPNHDLLVFPGVSWAGASAAQQISAGGVDVQILGDSL